ncbi:zinc-dependent metalloprotease [Allokutzneria sp. A3M-2-11 16]|uniref:zinc-dependent metalloprotease n=1 Tax=Allokutzneria sp. A3M-2-11 16 TaxID=2962043 RepID=UPI0020B74256|nr:zinc-dependent metalloprotease [Allokutzneria sp. A3M-2-11 16]MCP3798515.1 zinc-dependent metalloprotease [Allokutzneria sp. A3M-2-11 16]
MSDLPFGFSGSDPDKDPERKGKDDQGPQEHNQGFGFAQGMPPGFVPPGGQNPFGAGGFDMNQLGQMLSQLGQVLSQASTSSGPVNYDLAKQLAMQQLGGSGGTNRPTAQQESAVADAVRLAELWLDPATALPAGARKVVAWSAGDWVEGTLPSWQRLCDPVARQMSGAWVDAMPEEAKQAAGPLLSMVGQMGGLAFGSQLGGSLAQLGSEVLASTEVGLPLGPEGVAALLPANVEKFTEGLGRPASEVLVFLAAREAAHHRLFTHVPWLRQRLMSTVEEFAKGIKVDTAALENLAGQIDPANPQALEEVMSSGMLQPQNTPEQQAALARLETLLALVEGWVDVVVAEAVGDRLPGAEALRETLRRRRASGGPAEQTFATLVGLELRPRRLRAAAGLWRLMTDKHGVTGRDSVWDHPDFIPTSADLDDPLEFAERWGESSLDPIAELKRTEGEAPEEGTS